MLYDFPQPTPMIMVLGTRFTRASDIVLPDDLTTLARETSYDVSQGKWNRQRRYRRNEIACAGWLMFQNAV